MASGWIGQVKTNLLGRLGARVHEGAGVDCVQGAGPGFPEGLAASFLLASSQNFPGRVTARCAHYSAPGVRRRTTQVKPSDRRAIIREPGHGSEAEQLVQRHGPMKNVAAGQGERSLQVERGQDLPGNNRCTEIRGILR